MLVEQLKILIQFLNSLINNSLRITHLIISMEIKTLASQKSSNNNKIISSAGSTQSKFLSKSPNPQSKLMTNTNYGKFKGIPITN